VIEPSLAEEFHLFVESGGSVVEGALLVARIVNAQTDTQWCRAELQRLAHFVGLSVAPMVLVDSLREQGFRGVEGRDYKAEDSSLENVLRERSGIPISLAVVLIGIAECLKLKAFGINFPQRFLVAFGDVLVDPFAMQITTEEACRAWLRHHRISDQHAFKKADPVDVVLRMLNNLRTHASLVGDYGHALALMDYQLILKPDAYNLYIDRADIWLLLGSPDMGRKELERALLLADEQVKTRIRWRLKELSDELPLSN
jgi:regulator of sirC expression with transglutaminase-like and TPR domain